MKSNLCSTLNMQMRFSVHLLLLFNVQVIIRKVEKTYLKATTNEQAADYMSNVYHQTISTIHPNSDMMNFYSTPWRFAIKFLYTASILQVGGHLLNCLKYFTYWTKCVTTHLYYVKCTRYIKQILNKLFRVGALGWLITSTEQFLWKQSICEAT